MYNEKIKIKFLDSYESFVGEARAKARSEMISIFNRFEDYEREKEIDICHFDIADYPEIIMSNGHPLRFSSFANIFRRLVQYKKFCIAAGLYDPALMVEYTNNRRSELSLLSETYQNRILYDEFHKYEKKLYLDISTSDKLFEVLQKSIKGKEIPEEAPEHKHHCISLYELVICFAMLQFYGVAQNDVCEIKKDEIQIKDDYALITIYGETKIEGEFVKLLQKMLNPQYNAIIQRAGRSGIKISDRNNDYPFAYGDDDDDKKRLARTKKYRGKYYTDMYDIQQNRAVSLEDIKFHGDIHKMKLISKNIDEFKYSMKNIDMLYRLIGRKPVKSNYILIETENLMKELDI